MNPKSILTTLITLLLCSQMNAQQVDLKYKLKANSTYKFNQETNLEVTQTIGSMEQEVSNSFSSLTRFKVIELNNEEIKLKVAFETINLKIKSPFLTINFNSDIPVRANDILGTAYMGLVNKEFTMVMDHYGRVKSVVGMNKIIDNSIDKLIYATEKRAEQLRKTLHGNFSNEAIKSNMNMVLGIYPTDPKEVGEKWVVSSALNASIVAKVNSTYTLNSNSSNIWSISSYGKVNADAEKAMMNGVPMRVSLDGSKQSKYDLNSNDGWFNTGEYKQSVSGFVEVINPSGNPGSPVPIQISSITKIERR